MIIKLKEKFFVDTFAMRCWPEVILNEFYGIAVAKGDRELLEAVNEAIRERGK